VPDDRTHYFRHQQRLAGNDDIEELVGNVRAIAFAFKEAGEFGGASRVGGIAPAKLI